MSRVACVQIRAGADVAANLARTEALIREAYARGAQLITLPEVVDFRDEGVEPYRRYARPLAQHTAAQRLASLAAELRVFLLAGSLTIRAENGMLANRSLLFDPHGTIIAQYDKIHLFDTGVIGTDASKESDIFVPGSRAVLAPTAAGRLGFSICYDLRFPHLYRDLAKAGAQLLAVPSNFLETTGRAHWHVLLRTRAIENGCYVLAPAQCGESRPGKRSFGHSLIVDPWGEVLADAGPDEERIITADVDEGRIAEVRDRIRSLQHDRPFVSAARDA
ncbi:MAG TPA: carbon-nitrogen hydrolase family protein [Steroidobacteraceae bacterium]|nr:carbon-nitrogen hydrolase family protein [Steroidobacteraceae bacterium]